MLYVVCCKVISLSVIVLVVVSTKTACMLYTHMSRACMHVAVRVLHSRLFTKAVACLVSHTFTYKSVKLWCI